MLVGIVAFTYMFYIGRFDITITHEKGMWRRFSRFVGFCHGVGSDTAPGYGRTHGQSALSTNSNRHRIGMELGRTYIETTGNIAGKESGTMDGSPRLDVFC